MIRQIARYRIEPNALDEVLAAIGAFVDHIRANEPRTTGYRVWQEVDEPTRFVHLIEFENEAARETHANSDAVNRFTSVLYPRTIDGVEFTTFEEISAKG